MRRYLAAFLALFVLAAFPAAAGPGVFEDLTIVTKTGEHRFSVEVMRAPEDRMRGMMFRRELAPDKGMLFTQDQVGPASFWMKNTYVSLDILFIREDGVIHRIEKSTEPLSTTPILSGAPVLGILEIVAGTSDRLGIAPGDRVEHSLFKTP
jgi:uncharacterized membrane protein (UPF0127 family)